MKKKQSVLTIISANGKFLAPNRATARKFEALKEADAKNMEIEPEKKFDYFRLAQTPKTSPKAEFKEFRRDLAKEHGSKTGQLKKKHLAREKGLKVRGER